MGFGGGGIGRAAINTAKGKKSTTPRQTGAQKVAALNQIATRAKAIQAKAPTPVAPVAPKPALSALKAKKTTTSAPTGLRKMAGKAFGKLR